MKIDEKVEVNKAPEHIKQIQLPSATAAAVEQILVRASELSEESKRCERHAQAVIDDYARAVVGEHAVRELRYDPETKSIEVLLADV